jgi:hypothetical protein
VVYSNDEGKESCTLDREVISCSREGSLLWRKKFILYMQKGRNVTCIWRKGEENTWRMRIGVKANGEENVIK